MEFWRPPLLAKPGLLRKVPIAVEVRWKVPNLAAINRNQAQLLNC
jgi:hypothetical protein